MPPLPRKQAVALDLLERTSVFVHLDPRRPGVIVPQGFLKQPQLVLQIGLNMAIAIPDLDVGDEGITCTLSFNKRPHFCRLPWSAIYALIGEQGGGMVWPEDVPPEVVTQQQAAAKKETKPRKPGLRAISGEAADRNAERAGGDVATPRRSEPPRPTEARRELRNTPRPPRLVQVVSNPASSEATVGQTATEAQRPEPQPSSAQTSSSGAHRGPDDANTSRSEELPASARDKARDAGREDARSPTTKRSRPPYLRLVD